MGFDMGNLRMNSSWYVSLILGLLACFVYQCQAEVAPVASVIGNAVKSEVRTHGLLNAVSSWEIMTFTDDHPASCNNGLFFICDRIPL